MVTDVILLVCADSRRQQLIRHALLHEGLWVIGVTSPRAALSWEGRPRLDLVIISGDNVDPAGVARLSELGPVLRHPEGQDIHTLIDWAMARTRAPLRATGT